MRTRVARLCCQVVLPGLLLAGCMLQNLSASERFSQSAFVLNDAARWGRLDVARAHIDPSYVSQYTARHSHWGSEIQIAEADVVSMQIDEDKEHAVSRVEVAWYSTDTMSLRGSVILQRWKAEGQDFVLLDEEIQGDPRLFAAEAGPTETQNGEAEPPAAAHAPATEPQEG